MKRHFTTLAAYNRWANTRLYAMADRLPDELFRKPVGVYFKSLHGTLNHLLTADLIWLSRLEGKGDHPGRLDAIVHESLAPLRAAREATDQRLVAFVAGLNEVEFEKLWTYRTLSGVPQQQPVCDILSHLFNHQAHHRGQAHAALTLLGVSEPEPLDLLIMMRERG